MVKLRYPLRLLLVFSLILSIGCVCRTPKASLVTPETPILARVLEIPKQKHGQDTLGAAKFTQADVATIQPGEGRGHFSNTFGDIVPTLLKEIQKGISWERIHLGWKDNHSWSTADFPGIQKEAKRLCPLVVQHPEVAWYFSGACEHNLNQVNARALAELVLKTCPNVTYVNTPMGNQGAILPEYINEFHGAGKPRSPKCAFSSDGNASEDANITQLKADYANCEYFLMWGPRYNGKWESTDTTPRPNRKGWPDISYIQSEQYLFTDKGVTSTPNHGTWKSHSENKGTGDPRAEKPVLLMPQKAAQVLAKRGSQLIDTLKYYGTYADGRFRYYATKWGYRIGIVDLWANNKIIGHVNAGFRDGDYR